MLLPTFWHRKLLIYNYRPLHSAFNQVCFLSILRGGFLVGDFNAQISSHQGHDLHIEVNNINMVEVPRPHMLRESKDIDHYIAFRQFLMTK